MKKLCILFFLLLSVLTFSDTQDIDFNNIIDNSLGQQINVGITRFQASTLYVRVQGGNAYLKAGQTYTTLQEGTTLTLTVNGAQVVYNGKSYSQIYLVKSSVLTLIGLSKDGRTFSRYRGDFDFLNEGGTVMPIDTITTEEYLYSVVPSEIGTSFPTEAIKAQAVAARSYLYYNLEHSKYRNYDIKDSTDSQMYLGYDRENKNVNSCVNATTNQVMLYNGQPIQAFFSSDAGPFTADSLYVWGTSTPYLKAIDDSAFQGYSPKPIWSYSLSYANLSSMFGFNVTSIQILGKNNGRVIKVLIHGTYPKTLTGQQFRQKIGYTNLKSTYFDISSTSQGVTFTGRGFGHGVGMSQWGAYGMAKQGYTYKQILQHYYSNITIQAINNWKNL